MADQRKRVDITTADNKQLGFEYQYLYFIVKLFQLKPGDEVGYEALDDVHTVSHHEQRTCFFQLKHTVETTASGEQPNLTKLSEDLWKTLSNWSKLISDKSEGRKEKAAQKAFINRSKFAFIVNRNIESNEVIDHIQKLQRGKITGKQFILFLRNLNCETQSLLIKDYINDVLGLGEAVLTPFMYHTNFVNTPNTLFNLIRDGIRDKMIPEENIDDVLGALYLQLKEDFFDKVQKGQHQVITYSEWIGKYQSVFNINTNRTTLLPMRIYRPILPEHLEQQSFVKELIEIGAIDMDDDGLAEIAELTEHYLHIELQLEDWYQEGKITYSVRKKFHDDAVQAWKLIHKSSHRSTKSDCNKDNENALACFDNIMKEKLALLSIELGPILSNGEFIKLANDEKIGWKYSWKDRYYSNGI